MVDDDYIKRMVEEMDNLFDELNRRTFLQLACVFGIIAGGYLIIYSVVN
ncbi:MAG: hypothetical protein GKR93_12015 [Gammaproteobacteria bacterium]|nr:hypothetical protein [Gammaproteobacteria bacterium]